MIIITMGNCRLSLAMGNILEIMSNKKIEDRIDEIIVELYEGYRIEREKREAEHRRILKNRQRKREPAERKELEKQKTQELVNEAKDYQIACEIRNYIAVLKESNKSDETEWFKWAEEKADWFDPHIIRRQLLGKRNHKADIEEKQLISKKRMSSYNW